MKKSIIIITTLLLSSCVSVKKNHELYGDASLVESIEYYVPNHSKKEAPPGEVIFFQKKF